MRNGPASSQGEGRFPAVFMETVARSTGTFSFNPNSC